MPGLPQGKPAGQRCLHLLDDFRCALWGDAARPAVCADFRPEVAVCGNNRQEALQLLDLLEQTTLLHKRR